MDGRCCENMTITHRERVLLAIERKETDRVPIDMCGGYTGPAEVPSRGPYTKLARYLGIEVEEPKIGLWGNVVNMDERILQRFDIDFRRIYIGARELETKANGVQIDEWGIGFKSVGLYAFPIIHPLKDVYDIRQLDEFEFPDVENPIYVEGKEKEAKLLHEKTDCAIVAEPGYVGYHLGLYSMLVGWDRALLDMKRNPEFFKYLYDRIVDWSVRMLNEFLRVVGDYIDIVAVGDDFGTQNGPMMSVTDFRKFIRPGLEKIIRTVKNTTKAKFFLHSDGCIYPFIMDLAEIGVDILNPIQPRAKLMQPEILKKNFGNFMCFHGGIDNQQLLPHGKPVDVRNEVRRIINIFSGRGYILGSSHLMGPEVPPENIVEMYDTARAL
jgi:uroporphyrinogen decarboxylase